MIVYQLKERGLEVLDLENKAFSTETTKKSLVQENDELFASVNIDFIRLKEEDGNIFRRVLINIDFKNYERLELDFFEDKFAFDFRKSDLEHHSWIFNLSKSREDNSYYHFYFSYILQ